MPRHSSRRVGAFRVRPVPDGADGCRDTGSGSGVPGPKRAAVQAEGTIRGPQDRRLRSIGAAGPGGFRKSESDRADGCRGRRGWRCRREARSAGRKAGACGRSEAQGREAFEKANRTEQTGAGIPEAVRGCRSRKRRHPEKTDKQAAALLRLRKYDRSEAEFFRSREKPHPIQREQKCNGSLRIDRFS